MNVDIERVSGIIDELDQLKESDVLFIDENGESRFAIIPIETYDAIDDMLAMFNDASRMQVQIANPENIELSYDEYERSKQQIMDVVEKTLMPKPEKLN